MSIETEFESTITNVKNAYQGLDNLGATIPQNKTIENIKNCLDEIYAKFPKTDYAEGSNITLSNTLKGKLDFEDGIVGIGDTSQKSYEGYNVYNSTLKSQTTEGITVTKKEDGTYILNGTCTANNWLDFHFGTNQIDETKNYRITAINSVPNGLDIYTTVTESDGTTKYPLINTATGTTINNSKSVLIFARINSGITLNNIIIKPMVSSDISKTYDDFEPYVGGIASPNPSYPQDIEVVRGTQTVYIKDENNNIIDTKTINLGEYEFAKIGNYIDTIEYDVDEDKVYKNEAIEKVILNGSENWTLNGNQALFVLTGITIGAYTDSENELRIISNHYSQKTFGAIYNPASDYGISFGATSGDRMCIRNKDLAGNISNFTSWLSTHNTIVYYALAETIREEITGTLKDQIKALYYSHSFTGTTIIESNGDLPMIIKVRALKGES